jgi:hypothetical protein
VQANGKGRKERCVRHDELKSVDVVSGKCASCGKWSILIVPEFRRDAEGSFTCPDSCPYCGRAGWQGDGFSNGAVSDDFARDLAEVIGFSSCDVCGKTLLLEERASLELCKPGQTEELLTTITMCSSCAEQAAHPRLLGAALEWLAETEQNGVTLYDGLPLAEIDRALREALRKRDRGD